MSDDATVRELQKQTVMMAEKSAQPAAYAGFFIGIGISIGLFSLHVLPDNWWVLWLGIPFASAWAGYKLEYARLTR